MQYIFSLLILLVGGGGGGGGGWGGGGRDFSIKAYTAEAPHFIADTVGILS